MWATRWWGAGAFAAVLLSCSGGGGQTHGHTDTDSGSSSSTTGEPSSSGPSSESSDATSMGSGSGSATSGGSSTTTGPGGSTTGEPAALQMYTLLADDGRLGIHANLSPSIEDCDSGTVDAPCEDLDEDGLVDAWEDGVLQLLHPIRRMDEEESLFDDAEAVIADVGRVSPGGPGYLVYIMLGYSRDYGSCGITSHNGDSERVALQLEPWPEEGPGGLLVHAAYTAAHEGSVNDHGRVFTGSEVADLVMDDDPQTGDPRWVVFPSENKHATYATVDICEGISVVPCFDEDCAPDGVTDPEAYDLLPSVHNAGELDARRLDDLGDLGFPGDSAWADQDFCGGLGGSDCSSSVRSKLLEDPF